MAPDLPLPLSRTRLTKILGLESDASDELIFDRGVQLLSKLEDRRAAARSASASSNPGAENGRIEGLDEEIRELFAGLAQILSGPPTPLPGRDATDPVQKPAGSWATGSTRRILLACLGLLVLFGALRYAAESVSGTRGIPPVAVEATASMAEGERPAELIVSSQPEDALLRVRNAETGQLVEKRTGASLPIELAPGRYEVEVSREDCPDRWTQTIELAAGESQRFDASICLGTGELVVRSNVTGDRLRIDRFDVGSTRSEAHLVGVGDHRIRVSKAGYQPFEATVRIRPGERVELHAEMLAVNGPAPRRASSESTRSAPGAPSRETAEAKPSPPSPPTRAPSPAGSPLPADLAAQDGPLAQVRGSGPPAPIPFPPRRLDLDADAIDGGSTTWHDRIRARVLANYDTDHSGSIDRVAETDSIPCAFWRATERSFDEGGLGISMSRLYGFDGSEWHPRALGFDRGQRAAAYGRMRACGLAE